MATSERPKCVGAVTATLALVLVACGGDGGGGGGDSGGRGRGTPACQDWQDAICDFAADECGGIARAECDSQYKGAECRSDEQASACANAFNQATCLTPPPNCDAFDIADPAPAIAKCHGFIEAVCETQAGCGTAGTMEECVTEVEAMLSLDCDNALTVDLRYEECLVTLRESATCGMLPATALGGCKGLIRVTQ